MADSVVADNAALHLELLAELQSLDWVASALESCEEAQTCVLGELLRSGRAVLSLGLAS